jgi:hypothetical protein
MPNNSTPSSAAKSASSSSPSVVDAFSKIIHDALHPSNANDGESSKSNKKQRIIQFTPAQFDSLLQTLTTVTPPTPCNPPPPPSTPVLSGISTSASMPAYYNNAKYEEITCKPLKPLYDGSEDNLMPFLTHLDVRRQNEGWALATYISVDGKTIDLCLHFAQITADQAKAAATLRWNSPTVHTDKHTIGHETCNSRQLAIVLMGSISDALSLIILHRVPCELRNDGTYILWTNCNNVHRNNVALTEHVCEKITNATLQQFSNNVEDYIIFIKDNLCMLSSDTSNTTEHRGLITYIL